MLMPCRKPGRKKKSGKLWKIRKGMRFGDRLVVQRLEPESDDKPPALIIRCERCGDQYTVTPDALIYRDMRGCRSCFRSLGNAVTARLSLVDRYRPAITAGVGHLILLDDDENPRHLTACMDPPSLILAHRELQAIRDPELVTLTCEVCDVALQQIERYRLVREDVRRQLARGITRTERPCGLRPDGSPWTTDDPPPGTEPIAETDDAINTEEHDLGR